MSLCSLWVISFIFLRTKTYSDKNYFHKMFFHCFDCIDKFSYLISICWKHNLLCYNDYKTLRLTKCWVYYYWFIIYNVNEYIELMLHSSVSGLFHIIFTTIMFSYQNLYSQCFLHCFNGIDKSLFINTIDWIQNLLW